ncbi:AAA domain (dynein-related subfamily) [Ruminococcaceae bacterium YRB3002]|nr:AAA domain (dynein-related subfamily) [Ruminococcaceae bacterium YRB3002]
MKLKDLDCQGVYDHLSECIRSDSFPQCIDDIRGYTENTDIMRKQGTLCIIYIFCGLKCDADFNNQRFDDLNALVGCDSDSDTPAERYGAFNDIKLVCDQPYLNQADLIECVRGISYDGPVMTDFVEEHTRPDSMLLDIDYLNEVLSIEIEGGSSDDIHISKIREMIDLGIRQFVLTGAPGTGKTFTIEKFSEEYNTGLNRADYFVQFHPSYDYTDFVEGIRPIQVGDDMKFVRMDGIFKSFCRKVAEMTGDDLKVFVIDEINRADLSKVFGEMMYCLEESKRGEEHRIATQYQNLKCYDRDGNPIEDDVFSDGFYIPENVIVIGSMNDIDRSVESFDFALRRRFRWIEVGSMDDMEEYKAFLLGFLKDEDLTDRLISLNEVITGETGEKCGLDKNYIIGPAYIDKDTDLEVTWKNRIEPLLKEYCRGQRKDEVDALLSACRAELLGDE